MNFSLLKELCEAPGIPSREEAVRKVVAREMRPLVDEMSVDAMGSLVCVKKGTGGPRVMVAAHMDEIGFMVKHIDSKGFIRLQPLGGWDPRNMVSQRVYVYGYSGERMLGAVMSGAKPTHLLTEEEKRRTATLDELFVDVGLPADRVNKLVEVGDMVTMARTAERVGDMVLSKTLDDRVCVFVMIEALRALKDLKCEVVAVATTQEEVGLRGAASAAYALKPDVGIALDITLANDYPGQQEQSYVTQLGAGTAIKIMDGSLICHPHLVTHMRKLAQKHGIVHQLEVLPRGGTDAGAIQRSRGGVPSMTLSVPTRYVHTVNEMASVADIEATVQLLARYLEDAHTGSYGYSHEL